jgi:hypothetical protein
MKEIYIYIAGLFDGEGYIGIQKTQMRIVITSANKIALQKLAADCGKGYVGLSKGKRRGNRGPSWQWKCIKRGQLFPLIEGIAPYVRIKKPQIEIALRVIQALKKDSVKNPIVRDFVIQSGKQIALLNSRKRQKKLLVAASSSIWDKL